MIIKQIGNRLVLIPEDNKVVTDGKEIYSFELWLDVGGNKDEFSEITIEEYEKILEREAELNEHEDIQLEEEW